jgi:hypothetical protein
MAIPLPQNTTCDIYRTGNAPPAAPDVSAQKCHLKSDWQHGREAGEGNANVSWTHVMLVDVTVDIRDWYAGQGTNAAQDTVYIPDKNGSSYRVVFVERLQRGTSDEHKRVYLDRQAPTWPTNEL